MALEGCGARTPGKIVWWLRSCLFGPALLATACGLFEPEDPFIIETSRTEYELQGDPNPGWRYVLSVEMDVAITNPTDRTVYLHRACGFGDAPTRLLVRVGDDTTRNPLGDIICITRPPRAPIPVGPGATYADHVVLSVIDSPNSSHTYTVEELTGTFQFVYQIQPSDRVDGWSPVNPFSSDRTTSNTFTFTAPAGW